MAELAGVLLGKTSVNSLYGPQDGLPQTGPLVSAHLIRPMSGLDGTG